MTRDLVERLERVEATAVAAATVRSDGASSRNLPRLGLAIVQEQWVLRHGGHA